MSRFRIRSSFPIYNAEGVVEKTLFELYTDSPTNILSVYLEGKHSVDPNNEQDYIKKCLDAWHKEYFAEIEFANTTKKVDELVENISETEKENKRRDDFIEAMVLNTIMSENVHYGIVYKKLASLISQLQVGKTYERNEIATFLDESHTEVAEEGKLVIVQFNQQMVYNGEPLSSFAPNGEFGQNGKALSWPFKIS
jgi:hypothetical protein|nr:MAG TPA: Protein of unknown function (DUF1366) [Caudoviricetes sp.]